MAKLKHLATLVRSKNAKPFLMTIDIMFRDEATYRRVKESGVLTVDLFAQLYRTRPENILFIAYDQGYSFKVTLPRPVPQGDVGDRDMHAGQQHSPLLELEIPVDAWRLT